MIWNESMGKGDEQQNSQETACELTIKILHDKTRPILVSRHQLHVMILNVWVKNGLLEERRERESGRESAFCESELRTQRT